MTSGQVSGKRPIRNSQAEKDGDEDLTRAVGIFKPGQQ